MKTLVVLCLFFLSQSASAAEPKKDKQDLFEWFLQTWEDVSTNPKDPDAIARTQLKKCYHCHRSGNKWAAPFIPFNNTKKLEAWMKTKHQYEGSEIDGREFILKLIWIEQHMPKSSIKFYERKALKNYIEKL